MSGGVVQARGHQAGMVQALQRLGAGQHGQIHQRLQQDDAKIGGAEAADRGQRVDRHALAVEGPEGHPGHHAALIGHRQFQHVAIAQIDIGPVGGQHPAGQRMDREQRHQQRGGVDEIHRQVGGREDHALDQQAGGQPEGGRAGAQQQQQGGAQDDVHLGDTDREMRQDLEEHQHRGRCHHRAGGKAGQAAALDLIGDQLERDPRRRRGGAIGQHQLGAVNDSRFDMHISISLPPSPADVAPTTRRVSLARQVS